MKCLFLYYCLHVSLISFSQAGAPEIFRITSSHTSFPDTARSKGHQYNKILYGADEHYRDSSVLIIVPKNIKARKKVDLVFWFHGWFNNIDSSAKRYELIEQFAASETNAVLVLAETSRNAPDSYGGKLEYNNTFKELTEDVIQKLRKEKVISGQCIAGNILLAGHSGAYRVIAFILANGNMPVQEVMLFDALYSQTDKYLTWIRADHRHRFINIYTDGGGTDDESKEMAHQLMKLSINTDTLEERELTPQRVSAKKILFIHSLHKHNDVINNPDNFQLFLENSSFLKKINRQ